MGSSAGRNAKGPIVDINVTPLVDITLVLLIIMMVSANFIAKGSIKIELPRASTAEDAPISIVGITINRDGYIFLNGVRHSRSDFIQEVETRFASDNRLQAVIDADKNVKHGVVVEVIDIVKAIGIENFAISIEKGNKQNQIQ